jgi:hypothetical protein
MLCSSNWPRRTGLDRSGAMPLPASATTCKRRAPSEPGRCFARPTGRAEPDWTRWGDGARGGSAATFTCRGPWAGRCLCLSNWPHRTGLAAPGKRSSPGAASVGEIDVDRRPESIRLFAGPRRSPSKAAWPGDGPAGPVRAPAAAAQRCSTSSRPA